VAGLLGPRLDFGRVLLKRRRDLLGEFTDGQAFTAICGNSFRAGFAVATVRITLIDAQFIFAREAL
jgi:hypothetical protein